MGFLHSEVGEGSEETIDLLLNPGVDFGHDSIIATLTSTLQRRKKEKETQHSDSSRCRRSSSISYRLRWSVLPQRTYVKGTLYRRDPSKHIRIDQILQAK